MNKTSRLLLAAISLIASSQFSQAQLFTPGAGLGASSSATNVGVGTAAPFRLFEVNGAAAPISYTSQVVADFINDTNSIVDISTQSMTPVNSVLRFNDASSGLMWTMGQAGNDNYKFKVANIPSGGLDFNVRMTILQNGNVGFGTEDPARNFVVDGGMFSSSVIGEFRNQGNAVVDIQSDMAGRNSVLRFQNDADDTSWMIGNDAFDGNAFKIADHNNDVFGGGVRMTILQNGNVGFGTDTPEREVHIAGDLRLSHFTNSSTISTGADGRLNLHVNNDASDSPSWIELHGSAQGGQLNLAGGQIDFLYGSTTSVPGTIGMEMDDQGNVKIGPSVLTMNTPAGYRLYVEEGILTEKVRVAVLNSAQWADYVFEDDYKLMPLHDVSNFIRENGHLPGVPSAETVAESGIDVATMDATLLSKIEELTLHIIRQEEEMTQMREALELLQQK